MLLAPVPGRPMFPVISARSMIACAVRVDSWPWFTPMVHQKLTRLPSAMRATQRSKSSRGRSAASQARSGVNPATNLAKSSKPLVCASTNARSIAPRAMSALAMP